MFGTVLIAISTVMHLYVFWRISSVPFIKKKLPKTMLVSLGFCCWAVFYLGRVVGHNGTGVLAMTLEFVGMNWMAALFLIFVSLLIVDLVTVFGLFLPKLASFLRQCALVVGVFLSVVALFQGMRSPVIREHEVSLAGLPDSLNGTVLVSRGTGTWGPRMRLWSTGEILNVTLRSRNSKTKP